MFIGKNIIIHRIIKRFGRKNAGPTKNFIANMLWLIGKIEAFVEVNSSLFVDLRGYYF
jgi:hypothetical protein